MDDRARMAQTGRIWGYGYDYTLVNWLYATIGGLRPLILVVG